MSDWVRELCCVKNDVNKRINERVLRQFEYIEIMKNSRISERVYKG